MEDETILTIANVHVESCGKPPHIVKDGETYIGYFENSFGEQFIYTYNRETKKATLWSGDCNWDEPIEVVGGGVTGIILNEVERVWLANCWKASAR
jgi:hypothetical protein